MAPEIQVSSVLSTGFIPYGSGAKIHLSEATLTFLQKNQVPQLTL